jgi:hypothetical protein
MKILSLYESPWTFEVRVYVRILRIHCAVLFSDLNSPHLFHYLVSTNLLLPVAIRGITNFGVDGVFLRNAWIVEVEAYR